jgi:hypothetical protein
VLDADELHVLRKIARDVPLGDAPTAAQALHAIARLGGPLPAEWVARLEGPMDRPAQTSGLRRGVSPRPHRTRGGAPPASSGAPRRHTRKRRRQPEV